MARVAAVVQVRCPVLGLTHAEDMAKKERKRKRNVLGAFLGDPEASELCLEKSQR